MAEEKTTETPKQDPAPKPVETSKPAETIEPAEKKTAENPKPTEAVKTESGGTSSSRTTTAPVKSGGGSAGLIIVIVVLVIAVLGVGGYFGFKYLAKKTANKLTGLTSTATPGTSTTITAGKISLQSVIDALMYPGSKVTDQKQEKDSAYKAELTLSSSDSFDTIKAYYQKLAIDKKWQVTRQGSSYDNNYFSTVTDGVFSAEIDVTKYDGYDTTEIRIQISGDELSSEAISVSATALAGGGKTATTARTASNSSSGSYIISDSKTRVISESELTNLSNWQLKVARNEIYARYGRPFVHKDLQCYFAKMSWYEEDSSATNPTLNSTESKNVATIQAYEEKVGSDLASSDSGCDTNS